MHALFRGGARRAVQWSSAATFVAPPRSLCVRSRCLSSWDSSKVVHGRPEEQTQSFEQPEAAPKTPRPPPSKTRREDDLNFSTSSFFASTGEKADMLQFQVYVRQRLAELEQRMPPRLGVRERAELAFLEEQVVEDHMSKRKRALRDPLHDVPENDITHTNLNLLSRFVSEAGAILPRKLTGVKGRKQRSVAKALKRAHMLALLPRSWKHPKYRHASYADQYSKPEEKLQPRADLDEFRDPPDIRYPNRDRNRGALNVDISRLARSSPGLPVLAPPSLSGRS